MGRAGVEQAGFGKHRAGRGGAGVEQLELELDRDLIVVDDAAQRLKAELESRASGARRQSRAAAGRRERRRDRAAAEPGAGLGADRLGSVGRRTGVELRHAGDRPRAAGGATAKSSRQRQAPGRREPGPGAGSAGPRAEVGRGWASATGAELAGRRGTGAVAPIGGETVGGSVERGRCWWRLRPERPSMAGAAARAAGAARATRRRWRISRLDAGHCRRGGCRGVWRLPARRRRLIGRAGDRARQTEVLELARADRVGGRRVGRRAVAGRALGERRRGREHKAPASNTTVPRKIALIRSRSLQ